MSYCYGMSSSPLFIETFAASRNPKRMFIISAYFMCCRWWWRQFVKYALVKIGASILFWIFATRAHSFAQWLLLLALAFVRERILFCVYIIFFSFAISPHKPWHFWKIHRHCRDLWTFVLNTKMGTRSLNWCLCLLNEKPKQWN